MRRTLRGYAPMMALAAVSSAGCAGDAHSREFDPDAIAAIDGELQEIIDDKKAPGISYAVVSPEGAVYEGSAGVVDSGSTISTTRESMFMAYSTTKVITSIVVLQLVEEGQMELDAPIERYVPESPYGDKVTVRHLLTHTGGVPNPMPLNWFWVDGEAADRDEALSDTLEKNGKLKGEPGERYRYSNIGYWLLERAVENTTQSRFSDVVEQRVFEPLEITGSASFELPPSGILATGHNREWSAKNALFFSMAPARYWASSASGWSRFHRLRSFGLGYGGLYASVPAFSAVLADLLRDDSVLLSHDSKAAMFTEQRTNDGESLPHTLGWVVGDVDGVRYLGKQGGGLGFHGNVRIYPDIGVATVFFANSTAVSTGPIDALSDRIDRNFLTRAAEVRR